MRFYQSLDGGHKGQTWVIHDVIICPGQTMPETKETGMCVTDFFKDFFFYSALFERSWYK